MSTARPLLATTSSGAGAGGLGRSASLGLSSALQSAELLRAERSAAARALRASARPSPELHVLGEILGGSGFGAGRSVCCKWALEAGDRWELVEGAAGGQTQTDSSDDGLDAAVWGHPIDAHYVAGAMQGWPRLLFQVWALDDCGRLDVEGYGMVHVPTAPGLHELSCETWRPLGTPAQEWAAFFVGGTPALKSTAVLCAAASERNRLATTGSGKVHVRLELMQRHMDLYGLEGACRVPCTLHIRGAGAMDHL